MSKPNNSVTLSLHKFHLLNKANLPMNTHSLWAEDWKDAIKTFRAQFPGTQFMTDVEFNIRLKNGQRRDNEEKKAA